MKKRIRPNLRKTDYADTLRENDKLYQRKRRAKNPEWKAEQNRKWRLKNKKKEQAQTIAKWKYRNIKNKKCRDCERTDTHMHHPNYNKPDDVIWLCPVHHKLEHLKIKGRKVSRKNN